MSIPHTQLDQQPDDGTHSSRVFEQALRSLPGLVAEPSRISVPGAKALVLEDAVPRGPLEAFMIDREFAHVHPGDDHSLHLTLPLDLAREAQQTGWAEPHFLVASGALPATVVMVYAPRDRHEREVVLTLLRASYTYATSTVEAGPEFASPRTPGPASAQ